MFMILAIDIKIVGSVISVLYIFYVSWYTQPKSVSWRENTKKEVYLNLKTVFMITSYWY